MFWWVGGWLSGIFAQNGMITEARQHFRRAARIIDIYRPPVGVVIKRNARLFTTIEPRFVAPHHFGYLAPGDNLVAGEGHILFRFGVHARSPV